MVPLLEGIVQNTMEMLGLVPRLITTAHSMGILVNVKLVMLLNSKSTFVQSCTMR